MLKNKKIIIGFALVFLASVAYLIYYTRNQRSPSTTTPPSTQIKTPNIPSNGVTLSLSPSINLVLPDKFMVYRVGRNALDTTQADAITTGFGFTTKPQIINDPVYGTTYLLTREDSALTIRFQTRIIDYYGGVQSMQTGFSANEDVVKQRAMDFLAKVNALTPLKLVPTKVNYYVSTGEESVVPASLVQANLVTVTVQSALDNYPIVGAPALLSPDSQVQFNNKLTPLTASLTLPPLDIESLGEKAAISVEEVKNSLNQARLIALDNPNTLDPISDLFAGEVTIDKAYVAYYQYAGQTTLQPVLILEGTGKTKAGIEAQGTFVLPVLK